MIDWFVILIPLALLPIFLLFVFVGCVLTREGQRSAVLFTYENGLTELKKLDVHWSLSIESEEGESEFIALDEIHLEQPALSSTQTIDVGGISLGSNGILHCQWKVTKSDDSTLEGTKAKNKEEDETSPAFSLQKGGPDGYRVV